MLGETVRLNVLELAFATAERVAPIVRRIAEHDRGLADQLRRASQSIVLNITEAAGQLAGHRRERLQTALGSTYETRAAVRVAAAWGYIDAEAASRLDSDLDRIAAMIWRWRGAGTRSR